MGIAQAFESPFVRVLLLAVAIALITVLVREARKIPAKLFALMATATGQRPEVALRRLVLAKSLCTSVTSAVKFSSLQHLLHGFKNRPPILL